MNFSSLKNRKKRERKKCKLLSTTWLAAVLVLFLWWTKKRLNDIYLKYREVCNVITQHPREEWCQVCSTRTKNRHDSCLFVSDLSLTRTYIHVHVLGCSNRQLLIQLSNSFSFFLLFSRRLSEYSVELSHSHTHTLSLSHTAPPLSVCLFVFCA